MSITDRGGQTMKKFGVLVGAPLVAGFALFIATGAQAQGTTSSCLYPTIAAEEAFWFLEDGVDYLSGDGLTERTCGRLARSLEKGCKNVGVKQVQCFQKLAASAGQVGRQACATNEGEKRQECLDYLAEGLEFFAELISESKTEIRWWCAELRAGFEEEYCANDYENGPLPVE
jgi:hypothetical protein